MIPSRWGWTTAFDEGRAMCVESRRRSSDTRWTNSQVSGYVARSATTSGPVEVSIWSA
jgi:hypothetical protein